VPKSTSESQAQITHLLTAPEPARGHSYRNSTVGSFLLTRCIVCTMTNKKPDLPWSKSFKEKVQRNTPHCSTWYDIKQWLL